MFSTIRSFRHLLAGCACLSCLSVAAAQEESTPPAASQATTAASKVITLELHGDIKRHYLPTTGLTSYPNIFASDDTDYFLVLSVADEAFRFFVISWDSMCPTLIEEDWIDVVYGGYTCSDDMTERDSNLDIQRADMYKNYFALYSHGDRIQYYRADGKRIATVWEANTVRDKAYTENPDELPAYFELKQKIENGEAGSKAEVFQSNADIPSVQKAWEEREAAGLYYTQEKGKLIFHSAGQSSVVADISNKPILKAYKRRMTEEMSVFIWLCGSLVPTGDAEDPNKRELQNPEWYVVFADASGKAVSEKTIPCTCDYPLYTYWKCSEEKFTPQPLGNNVLLLSGIGDDKNINEHRPVAEYVVISPEGKQLASLLSPYYIFAFPYKVHHSYLLFSTNYTPFHNIRPTSGSADFIVLPSEAIDE